MTEENVQEEAKKAALPKTIEEIQAITHVPTTEATESFGRFVNKYLTNADNFSPLSPEQAWVVIGCHRVWQGSEERKAEKEALKAANEEAAEQKRLEREAKAEERARDKAAKEEEKARRAAERAAKKAAAEDAADDLDSVDSEGTGEIKGKKRRRPAPKAEPELEDAAL